MKHINDFVGELKKAGNYGIIATIKADNIKDDHLIIENKKTGNKFKVNVDSIYRYDWKNIQAVLDGRDPIILDQLSRIVGYYSRTSNWNKSKIGELKDRREGNYDLATTNDPEHNPKKKGRE